jgi:hypothetical protein
VSKVSDFARSHQLEKLGICFVFAFPVMVDTEVAAILEFFSPEVIEPDEILLDAMSRGGEQLGLVMERVQAREALERHRALLADAERLTKSDGRER